MSREGGAPATPGVEPWPYQEADRHGWPAQSDCEGSQELADELCKAKLEVRKKRTDQEIARAKAETDAALALEANYYTAVLEVAKGAIDRSRASADLVQKAAAAIVTLYAGVLALAFSVANNPLPGRALFAAVLLGLAIALSTAFLAFLPAMEDEDERLTLEEVGEGGKAGERLARTFVLWTRKASLVRAPWLRGAVVALLGAVILLPAPFVKLGDPVKQDAAIAWPKLPATQGNLELQKILYSAEVTEKAELRKRPLANGSDDELWTWGFVAFLILTLLFAAGFLPRRIKAVWPG
jgi:hypothetical protein